MATNTNYIDLKMINDANAAISRGLGGSSSQTMIAPSLGAKANHSAHKRSDTLLGLLGLECFGLSVFLASQYFQTISWIAALCVIGLSLFILCLFFIPLMGRLMIVAFSGIYGYLAAGLTLSLSNISASHIDIMGYSVLTSWQAWLGGICAVCISLVLHYLAVKQGLETGKLD